MSRQIWGYKEKAHSATSTTLNDLRQEFTKHLLAYLSGQLGDILPDIHDEEITLHQSRWKIAIIVIPLILGIILMTGLMTMMFIAVFGSRMAIAPEVVFGATLVILIMPVRSLLPYEIAES